MLTPPYSLARDALRLNVVFLRAQKRLSQIALAKRAGISRTIISAVENGEGNITLDVLEKIASAFETGVADLLTEQVKPGASDDDIARRAQDGPEAYVDADDFLAALDERAGRYSKRGRRKAAVPGVNPTFVSPAAIWGEWTTTYPTDCVAS
jgi:transcriptional regulator with XRE-family HTH domain